MPRIVVVGLGPADERLLTAATLTAIGEIDHRYVRTRRHPSAPAIGPATSFDDVYDTAEILEQVYSTIADTLIEAAQRHGEVLYAVPGSPLVAEHTVELLRSRTASIDGLTLEIVPAMSYLDLCWAALGIDPLAAGVRLVDGHRFGPEAAGERGPLLVAQCDSLEVMSDIKLSIDDDAPGSVTVLWHLGLPEQQVIEVPWNELDRFSEADHLTSIYIAELAAPVGKEMVAFHELVRVLREQCPWDREQTHHSLTRHLLEETYEVLEAIEAFDAETGEGVEHFAEELGDLLFQIYFHAVIAAQAGWFTLADVARGINDKLVHRHPHVFGEVVAATTGEVLTNWEQIKQAEKGHASLMDGIAGNLPALAYAVKVQRKAASVGFDWDDVAGALPKIAEESLELLEAVGDQRRATEELGDLLFAVCNVARHLDVDPEAALRSATAKFRTRFSGVERLAAADGADLRSLGLERLDAYWDQVKHSEP